MDFNAWVSRTIEATLCEGGSLTTLNINPWEVSFQIQPVAHVNPPTGSNAYIYPHNHLCLSVIFWHPSPDTDRMIPIASYPCLADDGLFPTAENIRTMTQQAVLAIDAQYGERQAVLVKEKG